MAYTPPSITAINFALTEYTAPAVTELDFSLGDAPTVALNTPADTATGQSTTPTLNFTGTDAQGDAVGYRVQVDTVNTFDSQGGDLADNFNDNSIDPAKWDTYTISSASVAESSGKAVVTPANSTAGSEGGYVSNDAFDFSVAGSSVQIELVQAADVASVYTEFKVEKTAEVDYISFGVNDSGNLFSQFVQTSSGTVLDTVAYNSGTHKYLRITNTGTKIEFYYSTDGVSWTLFSDSDSLPSFVLTSVKFKFQVYENSSDATPGSAQFDNFNFNPAPLIDALSSTDGGFTGTNSLMDSYADTNFVDGTTPLSSDAGQWQATGQSFTGKYGRLKKASVMLKKASSPTGNAVLKVYAHSGTYGTTSVPTGAALATPDTLDVSTLTTTMTLTDFTFSGANRITLAQGTYYVLSVEYSGGDSTNCIRVGSDYTSPTHAGCETDYQSSTWVAAGTGYDLIFYVYYDSPFPSATAVDYLVQSALSAGTTYYWRVRGIDPSGSNTWGAWATTRSFTTAGGGGTNMQINIGDSWKTVSGVQINIGDTWKTVSGIQINIGDAWKTVF